MVANRKIRVGVIAAAGKGTRAYPRTSYIPKPLFLFNGKTLLERNVEIQFKVMSVSVLYIIVGHLQEQVLSEVERIQKKYPRKTILTTQWTQQGLAADVASLKDRIKEDFCLLLGDEFYYNTNHDSIKKMWATKKKSDALIAVLPSPLVSEIRKNYSVVLNQTRVQKLIEKPSNPPNNLLGLGTYVFSKDYFEHYKNTPVSTRSGVIELTDVIQNIASKSEVHAKILSGRYFNINSLADYYAANYMIRAEKFSEYKISLVIPSLNNEKTIGDVLEDFKAHVKEIIVVDFGSKDHTISILKKFKNIHIIKKKKILDKAGVHQGSHIYEAMSKASGDIIVLCPADGSFRAGDLPKLLEYLKDCDMAIGTRTTRQMMEQGSNLSSLYRWLNVFFGKIVEILWWSQEPRFTDIGCIYRAIWRDSFEKITMDLHAKNKVYSLEMMLEIMRYHMRCIEIPVTFYKHYGYIAKETFGMKWNYFFTVILTIIKKRFRIN